MQLAVIEEALERILLLLATGHSDEVILLFNKITSMYLVLLATNYSNKVIILLFNRITSTSLYLLPSQARGGSKMMCKT
jgi:hypothetical protein